MATQKDILKDKAALHNFLAQSVKKSMGKFLSEAGEVPDAAPTPSPIPAPAPPPTNKVSVGKVANGQAGQADTPGAGDLQKGQITFEMVVDKLNSIRSGRSFKDENISAQMQKYFDDLNDNEKLALYAFLKGISQIVTGEIPAQQAAGPNTTHPELEVKSTDDGDVEGAGKVKKIKPNIVKRQVTTPSAPSKENTAPPAASPIVPKTR